jgi:hypothetical protein
MATLNYQFRVSLDFIGTYRAELYVSVFGDVSAAAAQAEVTALATTRSADANLTPGRCLGFGVGATQDSPSVGTAFSNYRVVQTPNGNYSAEIFVQVSGQATQASATAAVQSAVALGTAPGGYGSPVMGTHLAGYGYVSAV